MKILVIQQKMIGDVLVSSLLCKNLRYAYPNAKIDYLVYDSTKSVLNGITYIDELLLFTEKERNNKIDLLKFGLKIRKRKYDIIIDSYAKLESLLLVMLSGAKTKISFKKKLSHWFYDYSIKRRSDYTSNTGLIIEQRLALLEPLNIEKKFTFPEIHVSDEELHYAQEQFELNQIDTSKKTVMISILGSDTSKTYPIQYMAKLIDSLIENFELNLLFNYIPSQKNKAIEIFNLCNSTTKKRIYLNLIGNSIRDFIAIMNNCDAIIGNDGGAINMAKALHKPSFIIFSPWIDKKGWATFEDGQKNISFHLKDFKPELFEGKNDKEIKNKYDYFYHKFEPELISNQLIAFIKFNL